MAENKAKHVVFWSTLAAELERGTPLLSCLEKARATVTGTPLESASADIIEDVKLGRELSASMAKRGELFSRAMCSVIEAGEGTDRLGKVIRGLAEGLEDDSYRVPGSEPSSSGSGPVEVAQCFRTLGRLISSGVVVVTALEALAEETEQPPLSEAILALRGAVMEGRAMSGVMQNFGDLFDERVAGAVRWAEQNGRLDKVFLQIADALKAGDLSSLPVVDKPSFAAMARGMEDEASESSVIDLVNTMLADAIKARATDIHIDPYESKVRVRFRIDGKCSDMPSPPKKMYNALLSRLKIMARLDVVERRKPQDGKFRIKMDGKTIAFRVCVLPVVFGESIVLRNFGSRPPLRTLGELELVEGSLSTLRDLCARPNGLVVVTGPTGCGKSTLLYAMIKELDLESRCVISVEDPVEYTLENVKQVQLNNKAGLTYPAALRSALRQDPDVVVVGDLRDVESAEIAFRAAQVGMLVFLMMHAPTEIAVARMLDMGLLPHVVNSALSAVVGQRLVRKLCDECKAEVKPSAELMPAEAVSIIEARGAKAYGPVGCEKCGGLGYRGRLAIQEILIPDDKLRRIVSSSPDPASVRAGAREAGMKTIFENGMEYVVQGMTSVAEVARHL